MHGLTGNQEPRNWRTEELLHVGDDLRRQRETGEHGGSREDHQPPHPHRLRGWLGRHVIDLGRAVSGEAPRPPCPDLPQMGSHA